MNLLGSVYLTVYCFFFLSLMGAFCLFGMQKLIEPHWIVALVPQMRRALQLVLPLALGFLGVLFFAHPLLLKPELGLAEPAHAPFRVMYLATPFFIGRAIFYLAVWAYLAHRLKNERYQNGALVLIATLFTGSFAIFDWIMLFEAGWTSTIFGLNLLLSGLIIAFNLCVTLRLKDYSHRPIGKQLQDWNTLQLAFVGVWTYLSVMQWITIWQANLPKEVVFYTKRIHGPWLGLIAVIIIAQSVLPIITLLSRKLKHSLEFSRVLSYVCLVSQILFLFWIFGPAFFSGGVQ